MKAVRQKFIHLYMDYPRLFVPDLVFFIALCLLLDSRVSFTSDTEKGGDR